jgi:alginate O-acetyltransferase complex protein AlgI
MLFVDPLFLFGFLPLALTLHWWITRSRKSVGYSYSARRLMFALTLIFYGHQHVWWLLPFGISIALDFTWARLLGESTNPRHRRIFLALSIAQNLALLSLFKYRSVILATSRTLSPGFAGAAESLLAVFPDEMPAGISFYTFESLSFVIDIYRRRIECPKHPSEFFGFIGMFPRFIAGPIVRYKDLVGQFNHYPGMQIKAGLIQFALGLFMKRCFADSFAAFVSLAFDRPTVPSTADAWIGVLAFTMQIYFDFSGYSLMALGLGRCFGFRFPDNFRRPYLATSLQDFWRRWHMTLGTWLRDYLYIPLGGSQNGRWRTSASLLITMGIGGLWHGSGVNYFIWGIWHGGFLCLERNIPRIDRVSLPLRWAITFAIVVGGWVFFRAGSGHEALRILSALGGSNLGGALTLETFRSEQISLLVSLIGLAYAFRYESRWKIEEWAFDAEIGWARLTAATAMVAFSIPMDAGMATIPFLYFQF